MDTSHPRLSIAMSTMGGRYASFKLPKADPRIHWIMVIQKPEGDPASHFGERPDVTVLTSEETGLSRSRNKAVEQATTPWILLCDDDIEVDVQGVLALLERAESLGGEGSRAGFVWGRLHRGDGAWMARYPEDGTELSLRSARAVQSASLMISRTALEQTGIRFDPCFGLGTPLPTGEEYILTTDLLKAGWRGWHASPSVGVHPDDCSGAIWGDRAVDRGRAAVYGRVFGCLAPLLRARYAWAHRARIRSVPDMVRFTLGPRFL